MDRPPAPQRRRPDGVATARIAVGGIWLAGAAFNLLVTRRMPDPYGWLAEGSPVPLYRWFFGDVAGAHPAAWTVALAAGEATIGALTLCGRRWARLGLAGGSVFSALLFSLATPYTLAMGPYALFLAWLGREEGRHQVAGRSAAMRGSISIATPEKEILTDRPVEEVFDFVANARNEPRYNPNLVHAEHIPEGPIGPGTRFRLEGRAFGRTMETLYEVTTYDRPRRVASRTITGPLGLAIRGTVTVAPAPGGTRVRWAEEVSARGLFVPLAPLKTRLLGRRLDGAVGNLKRLMEAGNDET